MGAGESRPLNSGDTSIRGRAGFHVLRVADGSPAAEAGIEPFFDYVMGVQGQALSAASTGSTSASSSTNNGQIEESLARIVEEHEGRELQLQIWSAKRVELRDVVLTPSRHWAMDNGNDENGDRSIQEVNLDDQDPANQPSLLGLSLRLCNPEGALEKVWHILEILPGSPAESAGLVPYGDYILGYTGGVLSKESDFYTLVGEHEDKSLRLFVYNSDFDVTREVVIVPNRAWSADGTGQGLLGCGVGYGVLHRIPKPSAQAQAEQETRRAEQAEANAAKGSQAPAQQQQRQEYTSPVKTTQQPRRDSGTVSPFSQPTASPFYTQQQPSSSSLPKPPQPKKMTATLASSAHPATPPRTSSPSSGAAYSPSNSLFANKVAQQAANGPGWRSTSPFSQEVRAATAGGSPHALGGATNGKYGSQGVAGGQPYYQNPGQPPRSPRSASAQQRQDAIVEEEE